MVTYCHYILSLLPLPFTFYFFLILIIHPPAQQQLQFFWGKVCALHCRYIVDPDEHVPSTGARGKEPGCVMHTLPCGHAALMAALNEERAPDGEKARLYFTVPDHRSCTSDQTPASKGANLQHAVPNLP